MDIQSILIACGIGIVAGWLASLVVKGGSSGLLGNLVIGILGGFIGHWLLPKIGLNLPPEPSASSFRPSLAPSCCSLCCGSS